MSVPMTEEPGPGHALSLWLSLSLEDSTGIGAAINVGISVFPLASSSNSSFHMQAIVPVFSGNNSAITSTRVLISTGLHRKVLLYTVVYI